ncbi:MAG: hypothetical protein M3458_10235, partial [Acidobacteriota bacterium]|nr:hypothetical protein [Acidobacteriota bacterium]
MASIMLVNATDIDSWANRRTARDLLPQLLRRLVRATTERVKFISVRADEGVQLEGFDGVLEVETGNEFVPGGKSVWEFGTNKCESGVEMTDQQAELVEFSYHGKSTDSALSACLPHLRYPFR